MSSKTLAMVFLKVAQVTADKRPWKKNSACTPVLFFLLLCTVYVALSTLVLYCAQDPHPCTLYVKRLFYKIIFDLPEKYLIHGIRFW